MSLLLPKQLCAVQSSSFNQPRGQPWGSLTLTSLLTTASTRAGAGSKRKNWGGKKEVKLQVKSELASWISWVGKANWLVHGNFKKHSVSLKWFQHLCPQFVPIGFSGANTNNRPRRFWMTCVFKWFTTPIHIVELSKKKKSIYIKSNLFDSRL